MTIQRALALDKIIERLGREERTLRNLGAHANAEGVRYAMTALLRMADEEAPIDNTGEPNS